MKFPVQNCAQRVVECSWVPNAFPLLKWHQLNLSDVKIIGHRRTAEITTLAETIQHPFSSWLRWVLQDLEAVLDLEPHKHLQAVLIKSTEDYFYTTRSVTQLCNCISRHWKWKDFGKGSRTFTGQVQEIKSLLLSFSLANWIIYSELITSPIYRTRSMLHRTGLQAK